MVKYEHEFRDPVHNFIRLTSEERRIVDSRPFQRLRDIRQLATTSLVYPGATHSRFEHSLGVMEVASRIYDTLTDPKNDIQNLVGEMLPDNGYVDYWRRVVRAGALCHDIGHLPFSHAFEHSLPDGYTHEDLGRNIIVSQEMEEIWGKMTPPLRSEDVAAIAVGPRDGESLKLLPTVLSEIITGTAYGADRIDYLLRDSLHAGVAYGRFDHYRLIDTMRLLPNLDTQEPTIGIEDGGIHAAEALLLARYFMFKQLYMHPVRRAYDIHLGDFLHAWLPDGHYPIDLDNFLGTGDSEIVVALRRAAANSADELHELADRVLGRRHFVKVYERNPTDEHTTSEAFPKIAAAVTQQFGGESVRTDRYAEKKRTIDFPVLMTSGQIESARAYSEVVNDIPLTIIEFVFVDRTIREQVEQFIAEQRQGILEGNA